MKSINGGINVHLYPSNFLHESRIEKIASVLTRMNVFSSIWLIGIREGELPETQSLGEKVTLFRVGNPTIRRSLIRKLWAFLQYYIGILRLVKGKDISCVNAHSLSVLPIAVFLSRIKKCKVIYDTHELETETYGFSISKFRQRVAKIVERSLIEKMDAVFCVSEPISKWYSDTYKIPTPCTILNSPTLSPVKETDFLRRSLNLKQDQKIMLYLGIFEPGRGIEKLVDAFEIRNDSDVVAVFVGFGALTDFIKMSPSYGRNVFFHPAVPKERIPEVAASANIGVCFVNPQSLSLSYCMPNKLFEYLMSSLPVLVSPCVSLQSFVEKYRVGAVLHGEKPEEINSQIDEFLQRDLSALKKNARAVAVDTCWEVQSEILVSAYKNI